MKQEDRELEKRRAESRRRAWEAYQKAGGTMAAEPDDAIPHDRIGFADGGPNNGELTQHLGKLKGDL